MTTPHYDELDAWHGENVTVTCRANGTNVDLFTTGAEGARKLARHLRVCAKAVAERQGLDWADAADLTPNDAEAALAVARAKVAMYEGWLREHHPDCELLAENIVADLL